VQTRQPLKLTMYLNLVPRLRMLWALLPLHVSVACTDSCSLFLDHKDGDGTFLCNAGTILQQAAERKTTTPLHALIVCVIIVTLPVLVQYLLQTKYDPRCASLVSSVSSDEQPLRSCRANSPPFHASRMGSDAFSDTCCFEELTTDKVQSKQC
jgi:hypothetical protein